MGQECVYSWKLCLLCDFVHAVRIFAFAVVLYPQ